MIMLDTVASGIMIHDALEAFPDECCGFVLGSEAANGNRLITDVLVVNNAKEGDKRRRFSIAPGDYLRAEQYALERGLDLLGVYHSHPNHPAIPSEHDRVAAQPYFSYIILSVMDKRVETVLSWRLNEEGYFEEEAIQPVTPAYS